MHQHRQIHVWITESDYLLLREQAEVTKESVSAVIRRLVKTERQRLRQVTQADADNYTSDQSECGRLFCTIQP